MIEAALWGLAAASSLVLGSVVALVSNVPTRLQGLILAFGAGILFGTVAYELVEDALAASMTGLEVALGFGVGAVAFFVGSVMIDRTSQSHPESDRLPSRRDPRVAGFALVLGAALDGLPESIVLGLSLVPGQGVALPILVAIFLSNVPESLTATEDLKQAGMSRTRIVLLWVIVALACGAFAGIGFALLDTAPTELVIFLQALAAGAILAMLSESAFPEAQEKGGRAVGLAASLGFAVAAYMALKGGA